MKNRTLSGCLRSFAILIVICLIGKLVYDRIEARLQQSAIDRELELARNSNIPTTWQEFAASIPTAAESENSARYYRDLRHHWDLPASAFESEISIIFDSKSEQLGALKDILAKESHSLSLLQKATALPRCWFKRDWAKGAAVLLPEYADMKAGAKLLALCGSVEVASNNPGGALRDIQKVFVIAKHSNEEETTIATLVSESIYLIGVRRIALWSYTHPSIPAYQTALEQAIKNWPKVNLSRMHRDELLMVRSVLELSTSAKGLADLGIKSENIAPAERFAPLFFSRRKADVEIARSTRKIIEACSLPVQNRLPIIQYEWENLQRSLLAYPTGGDIYQKLASGSLTNSDNVYHDQIWEARRLSYVALARVLKRHPIAEQETFSDIINPLDHKPLVMKKAGKQIVIELNSSLQTEEKKLGVYLPSDSEMKALVRLAPKGGAKSGTR